MAVVKSPKHVKLKNKKAGVQAQKNKCKWGTFRAYYNLVFFQKKSSYNANSWRFMTPKKKHLSLRRNLAIFFN